jgi:hypothetical protein
MNAPEHPPPSEVNDKGRRRVLEQDQAEDRETMRGAGHDLDARLDGARGRRAPVLVSQTAMTPSGSR